MARLFWETARLARGTHPRRMVSFEYPHTARKEPDELTGIADRHFDVKEWSLFRTLALDPNRTAGLIVLIAWLLASGCGSDSPDNSTGRLGCSASADPSFLMSKPRLDQVIAVRL